MSNIANPFVVILDANVLFPVRVRDILLTFAMAGLFRARLTENVLEEWSGNLKAMKPHLSESVDRQARQIRSAFDEYFVTGFEPIIPALRLPDPDDRHVLAAAIKCSAQIIVTENQRDFPASHLDEFGIEALGADQFLAGTFELFPMECCRALRSIRTKYRAPPFSTSEFVMDMTRSGLPRLASLARSNIELL